MEVLEAIRARRSIRQFLPKPVADDAIEQVLDAARWAPSWGNNQCWRFVVVRDSNTKQQIADTMIPVVKEKQNPATGAIGTAPVVIVACAEVGHSGHSRSEPEKALTDKGDYWYMYDVALAMQNLTLAACSLGLGTVHTGSFDAPKVAEILGIPAGHVVVAITPLGYPEKEPSPRPRRELTEIVFHERYGAS